jgi:hypothetical protein
MDEYRVKAFSVLVTRYIAIDIAIDPSIFSGGVRGRVVKGVDFKPLAPHRCGFESQQGLWILSCEEAIQLAYGTSVVLLRCPFVPEIMHGRASEVFLNQ